MRNWVSIDIVDFLGLITWPEISVYLAKNWESIWILLVEHVQNNMMSSTYKEWDRMWWFLVLLMNFNFLWWTGWERPILKTSSTRQKIRGEKGSFCITPIEQDKKCSSLGINGNSELCRIQDCKDLDDKLGAKAKSF